jgi:hypothetical protein
VSGGFPSTNHGGSGDRSSNGGRFPISFLEQGVGRKRSHGPEPLLALSHAEHGKEYRFRDFRKAAGAGCEIPSPAGTAEDRPSAAPSGLRRRGFRAIVLGLTPQATNCRPSGAETPGHDATVSRFRGISSNTLALQLRMCSQSLPGYKACSLAQPMNRIINDPLERLSLCPSKRILDLHAPGRPDVWNSQCEGPAIVGDGRGGDAQGFLIMMF